MNAGPEAGSREGALVVAVDAMGGDHAPAQVVEGAIAAARVHDVAVALVGPVDRVGEDLARLEARGVDTRGPDIRLVDAPDVIGMDESPLAALRRKPRSSVRVAAELVATGRASALFTAGHSGAALLSAHAAIGMLPGVERPALAVTVPTTAGLAVLLDAGANLECRVEHLVEFARLGSAYAETHLGLATPRVGLLSIGEEAGKGTEVIREAHGRLRDGALNFVGNVEARDLFTGRADVVVCDGFTGNVALKVGEGLAEAIGVMLREELDAELVSQIGAVFTRRAFNRFRQRFDASEYGAAPLLGIRKLVLIGHGRSSARAVESGVGLAARLTRAGLVDRMGATLQGGA